MSSSLKFSSIILGFVLLLSCGNNADATSSPISILDADGQPITSVEVPAEASTQILNVEASIRWVLSFSDTWLSAKSKSGNGSGSFELMVSPNLDSSPRTGEVTAMNTDGQKAVIQVIQAADERPTTTVIKVMSFNILEGVKSDERAGYEWNTSGRKERCIAMFQAEKPDIFCLQECRRAQLQDLQAAFPEYTFYGYAKDGILKDGSTTDFSKNNYGDPTVDATFKNGGHRNVIAFKKGLFKAQDWGAFWISDTPYLASKYKTTDGQKLTLWVKLELVGGERSIYIACTHHIPSGYATAECPDVLTPSAQINVTELKKVIPEDATFMIFGDFNCNDTSTQIKPITDWLKSARLNCTDTDERATFSSGTRLDHIFYMGATPLNFRVVDCTAKPDDTTPTTYGLLSDHKPVWSEMMISTR